MQGSAPCARERTLARGAARDTNAAVGPAQSKLQELYLSEMLEWLHRDPVMPSEVLTL